MTVQILENLGLLYQVFRSTCISRNVKVTIYPSMLRPILLYGSEIWTTTTKTRSKIQAAEMRVLRLIYGVTKRDYIRNERIRREFNVESINNIIISPLRWYGNLRRINK